MFSRGEALELQSLFKVRFQSLLQRFVLDPDLILKDAVPGLAFGGDQFAGSDNGRAGRLMGFLSKDPGGADLRDPLGIVFDRDRKRVNVAVYRDRWPWSVHAGN